LRHSSLSARHNGAKIGKQLGKVLADYDYDQLHLIGHSAGSALINQVAKQLDRRDPDTRVHTTFLDAFALKDIDAKYGSYSDRSDHYVNIDLLYASIGSLEPLFDLDSDGDADLNDVDQLVLNIFGTWYGDANLDGEFNSSDLISVFVINQYEDGIPQNSTWATGDWNGDGDFETGDLIKAFQGGGYEKGLQNTLTVPEPSVCATALLGLWLLLLRNACHRDQSVSLFWHGLRIT